MIRLPGLVGTHTRKRVVGNMLGYSRMAMELLSTYTPLTLIVRLLYLGSIVAYAAHVWLVWRRVRLARDAMFGVPVGRPHRQRVLVRADVLLHDGEAFLFRDVMPAPGE